MSCEALKLCKINVFFVSSIRRHRSSRLHDSSIKLLKSTTSKSLSWQIVLKSARCLMSLLILLLLSFDETWWQRDCRRLYFNRQLSLSIERHWNSLCDVEWQVLWNDWFKWMMKNNQVAKMQIARIFENHASVCESFRIAKLTVNQ